MFKKCLKDITVREVVAKASLRASDCKWSFKFFLNNKFAKLKCESGDFVVAAMFNV